MFRIVTDVELIERAQSQWNGVGTKPVFISSARILVSFDRTFGKLAAEIESWTEASECKVFNIKHCDDRLAYIYFLKKEDALLFYLSFAYMASNK